MLVEGSWLMAVLLGVFPAVGVIGRLFGDESDDEEPDEEVDDLLNESFDEQVEFGELEEDDDAMFDEPNDRHMEEIESRVDDMETELGTLSSTVSTVRSENEEISDVIGNVEDDVRKLLEIYEMVTRGINPFIDDDVGMGEGSVAKSMNLFDEQEQESDDSVDSDILEADADEFFDEDAIADDPPAANEGNSTMQESTGGGKSFDELKEEFDSGDAEWAGEEAEMTEPPAPEGAETVEPPTPEQEPAEPGHDGEELDDTFDFPMEDESENVAPTADTPPKDPEPEPAAPTADESDEARNEESESVDVADFDAPVTDHDNTSDSVSKPTGSPGLQKPYLTQIPDHPVAELAVMEWLEYLVETTDRSNADAAVTYYGEIGWIAPGVVDKLDAYLDGFGPAAPDTSTAVAPTGLSRTEHVTTLQYLLAIDGASTRQFVGTNLHGLADDGVLSGSSAARSTPVPAPTQNGSQPGISADSFGEATHTDPVSDYSEEKTLPDGGLALPLDEESSAGVSRDGD